MRKESIGYIQNLSEAELVKFFYDAISARNENKIFKDGYEKDRICLIQTRFGSFENKEDEQHYSEFMALPSALHLDRGEISEWLTEQGECSKCGALVVCSSKEALCPICDTTVDCT